MGDKKHFVCRECGSIEKTKEDYPLCTCGKAMFIFGEEYVSFPKKENLFLSNIKYWKNALKSLKNSSSMMSEEVLMREKRKLKNRMIADEECYYNFIEGKIDDKI